MRLLSTLFLLPALITPATGAQELPEPQGRVILTISGDLKVTNRGDTAVFDRGMLEALPQVTIRTTTPWTDGETEFRGPLGRAVLARAGAVGSRLTATAINDYVIEIPRADFEDFGVILALQRDGKPMRTRDKGPLWIIYPWSDHTRLQVGTYYERAVWQLKALHVQ